MSRIGEKKEKTAENDERRRGNGREKRRALRCFKRWEKRRESARKRKNSGKRSTNKIPCSPI